jgi:predicted secreted protein
MVRSALVACAIAVTLSGLSPVSAQEKPNKHGTPDPNETICRKEQVLGSRLQTRKICMTRAQWAEQRLLDRQNIERAQVSGCQKQGGC